MLVIFHVLFSHLYFLFGEQSIHLLFWDINVFTVDL